MKTLHKWSHDSGVSRLVLTLVIALPTGAMAGERYLLSRSHLTDTGQMSTWAKGGVLIDPEANGEWGVTSFGLGLEDRDGDRFGLGGHLLWSGGDFGTAGDGPNWGAHLVYDLVVNPSKPLRFYGHFEFGFLAQPGEPLEKLANDVRMNLATGLGLEFVKRVRKTSLRMGTEVGIHWSLDAPYAVLHVGIDR